LLFEHVWVKLACVDSELVHPDNQLENSKPSKCLLAAGAVEPEGPVTSCELDAVDPLTFLLALVDLVVLDDMTGCLLVGSAWVVRPVSSFTAFKEDDDIRADGCASSESARVPSGREFCTDEL